MSFFHSLWHHLKGKLCRPSAPEKSFIEWCNKLPPSTTIENLTLERKDGGPLNDKDIISFFDEVYDKLTANPDSTVDIRINNYLKSDTVLIGRSLSYRQFLQNFRTPSLHLSSLTLDAFYISNFSIGRQNRSKIIIRNSRIRTLTIDTHVEDLVLHNTYIGKLEHVKEGSLKRFNMCGGGISQLDIPPSRSPNPFTGSVWFSKTWFPTDKHLPDKAQPYRNMRHHLRDLGNIRMADLFHALELKTERSEETLTNKFFNWLYEILSDYGASILRPILWLFFLGFLIALVLIECDGAVPTNALTRDASGWQAALLDDDIFTPRFRALYLSFYSIIHPLGLFGGQPVLIAKTPWLSSLLIVEGIFSATLIALTIFALRRRFKLQQS